MDEAEIDMLPHDGLGARVALAVDDPVDLCDAIGPGGPRGVERTQQFIEKGTITVRFDISMDDGQMWVRPG
jgi:hypothetical protein